MSDLNESSSDSGKPHVAALPEGRFSGPVEFSNLVRLALAAAAERGWRELILSDQDFHDWPLGERAVGESLNGWARSGRRLTLVAASYDEVHRRHARFVSWRQTWSHLIECRVAGKVHAGGVPSALWSPAWVFHRIDPVHMSGFAGSEVARRVALHERLAELVLKSSPGFPATTLGL
jgi:hypothetical protein